LLGFLPFMLLARSEFLLPQPQPFHIGALQWAETANPFRQVRQPVRSGIHLEVRLGERKVALYRDKTLLKTYPIAVGRTGWETPTGTFQVNQKLQNPRWIHPFTDEVIAPDDPRNPLGRYWIGFWSDGRNAIGFHGTPNPDSIGSATSHGCIRMYNEDIEELFHLVQMDTQVRVIQ